MRPATNLAAAMPSSAREVQQLFAGLRVERTPEDAMRIEAPPEVAGTLASLFRGLAQVLEEARR